MTPWQPRYQGGEIPAVAATAIAPGTFVLLTGANTQSGEYQVEPCGLGQTPFGVAVTGVSESRLAGRDPTSVELRVQVYRGRGVARVVPGAAISGPGVGIQSDGFGRAIPAAEPIAASLVTGGVENGLEWTAVSTGTGGNSITIAITNPGGTVAAEVVTVVGNGISVAGRTSGGVLTSTAAEIIAAIEASTAASALVNVGSVAGSDGSSTVVAFSATNLTGGASSGGGVAVGVSCSSAAADDPFVEVALYV